ncbi:hypothetical protein EV284_6486 [Streptomyces sp. BK022]|uniref:hypothetical protein n=1 Tax=Streptomyces sp. BK022 TaxID=2512123 RepID=UPI001028A27E|nr:hypothetical protein [Streptomyces sp. BK022]RZU28320.1 hypothetical protein EV284_6486 [Streptomyces sp. BK022]
MQLDRQTALALIAEGKAAQANGDPSDACPYDRLGNAEQQFGSRYWTKGWSTARSAAEEAQTAAPATAGH